uniref:Uncharacterized protein n=1 Tax=Romanomermis culicivorax TaxID=13658 RepID=A0A915IUL9_ROMCU
MAGSLVVVAISNEVQNSTIFFDILSPAMINARNISGNASLSKEVQIDSVYDCESYINNNLKASKNKVGNS